MLLRLDFLLLRNLYEAFLCFRAPIELRVIFDCHMNGYDMSCADQERRNSETCREADHRYFVVPTPCFRPKMRLFCFPYACGGVQMFKSWTRRLPDFVEVIGIQLPGRGKRIGEMPHVDLNEAADCVSRAIAAVPSPLPCMLFGHSMGALLAYEVAKRLEHGGLHAPQCLIVSGYKAPTVLRSGTKYHLSSDHDFLCKIRDLGGTPAAILNDLETMELLMPAFRADFAMAENYRFGPSVLQIKADVIAFAGEDDTEASTEQVSAWREVTSGKFKLVIMPGGHFFVHEHEQYFLQSLSREIERHSQAQAFPGEFYAVT